MKNSFISDAQAYHLQNCANAAVRSIINNKYKEKFDSDEVEETVSKTKFRALRSWGRFEGNDSDLFKWVYRIAFNTVLDELDHKMKRIKLNCDMYPVRGGVELDLLNVVGSRSSGTYRGDEFSADRELLLGEFSEQLAEFENRLSDRDKVIWNGIRDSLKPRQIAELTDTNPNVVSIRKHYILEMLKDFLAGLEEGDGIILN